MTVQNETRAPFAEQTPKTGKRSAGRTQAANTPLELRGMDEHIGTQLHDWVYDRMTRDLGNFAEHIERIQVRFEDDSGRGGSDKTCHIHLTLSKLAPVVIETHADNKRAAFDLAAGRATRALRHTLSRHGFHNHSANRERHENADVELQLPASGDGSDEAQESLFGRHVGHGPEQLAALQQRPEKVRRDLQVDTANAGVTASDRKVGYGHTGKRNTKLNTEGMAYKLEDSTTDRPTRKSTRGGHHTKADANLTLRTRAAASSPKSKALRSH